MSGDPLLSATILTDEDVLEVISFSCIALRSDNSNFSLFDLCTDIVKQSQCPLYVLFLLPLQHMWRLKFCNPSQWTNGIGGATHSSVSKIVIFLFIPFYQKIPFALAVDWIFGTEPTNMAFVKSSIINPLSNSVMDNLWSGSALQPDDSTRHLDI